MTQSVATAAAPQKTQTPLPRHKPRLLHPRPLPPFSNPFPPPPHPRHYAEGQPTPPVFYGSRMSNHFLFLPGLRVAVQRTGYWLPHRPREGWLAWVLPVHRPSPLARICPTAFSSSTIVLRFG